MVTRGCHEIARKFYAAFRGGRRFRATDRYYSPRLTLPMLSELRLIWSP